MMLATTTSVFASQIKLLSWNVYMLPKPIKVSWQKYRTEIISQQLSKSDYDVMFFQEAFVGSFHDAMKSKLKKTHPHHYYLGKNKFYLPMGSGVFIMSKYAFKVLDRVYYDYCGKEDCMATKGAVLIEMKLPGGKVVQFASTHLQSGEGPVLPGTRIKQLTQVKGMLKKHQRQDVPQLLLGDLNIDSVEPEFQVGLDLLGMDYLNLEGPIKYTNKITNECYKTSNTSATHEWIDHIWAKGFEGRSSSMKVKLMEFPYNGVNCALSDHHAVETVLSL